ncbi:hypothetical protein D9M71_360270 [compost metagenome]
MPLRGVFGQQRGGIGHACAQAQAGQKAQHQQLVDVGAVGRRQAEGAEQHNRPHQYHLAPETVGQRPGTQRTEDHADQGGTHHRPQAGPVNAPFLGQGRGDKAHGGGIEAVEEDNQEAQDYHPPLVARQRLAIDKGLHIKAVSDSSLRTIHYFYPEEARECAGARMNGTGEQEQVRKAGSAAAQSSVGQVQAVRGQEVGHGAFASRSLLWAVKAG